MLCSHITRGYWKHSTTQREREAAQDSHLKQNSLQKCYLQVYRSYCTPPLHTYNKILSRQTVHESLCYSSGFPSIDSSYMSPVALFIKLLTYFHATLSAATKSFSAQTCQSFLPDAISSFQFTCWNFLIAQFATRMQSVCVCVCVCAPCQAMPRPQCTVRCCCSLSET